MEEKTTAKVTFENLPKSVECLIELVKHSLESIAELKATIQNQQPKEYYTRDEVANLLNIDLSTLHNWVKKGKITKFSIGGRVYFKRSEIENAIIQIPRVQ
jgi:excisionase family DNA binding protein